MPDGMMLNPGLRVEHAYNHQVAYALAQALKTAGILKVLPGSILIPNLSTREVHEPGKRIDDAVAGPESL